jgi:phage terminase large subunit-like protein
MACIWIPRGNAKTTLAAALSLAHFMGPEAEAGGQAVLAAADRENAGIAFNSAWQMVQQDDALLSRVRAVESRKALNHPGTRGTLKAISHEAYSKHGLNVSFFLADEVHAWPPAEARKLFKVVTDSMVKRTDPLTIIISTTGEGTGGLAWDLWDYSQKVATGEIDDPTFAPIIFAAPPDTDWRDEAAWHTANPAIAAGFCSLEELRIKARRIEHFPAEVADFKRFHLNIWIEGAAAPWIDLGLYDAAEPAATPEALAGRSCYVGIDLSSVEDLTAVVAVFPSGEGEARRYDVLARFFLPEAGLARKAERDRADYLRWRDAGHLKVTEGNVVDHAAVIAEVVALRERYGVQEVAIDRWNSTAVNTALQAEGFTVAQLGQGFASMAAPVKELKRAILAGQFHHGGNPVLRMCFGNVVATKDDAENEKFTKERSRGRIDGAVAAAMAIGRVLAGENGPLVYERRPEFVFI